MQVPFVPEIAAKLFETKQTSKEKGKQHASLKVGSKKKRSKEQMNEVREEEVKLKADKQAFLIEMKRLKDLVDEIGQNEGQLGPQQQ